MKYIKKWKLVENSEFDIGIDRSEIEEIFIDLIDIGYEISINNSYLTSKGVLSKEKRWLSQYYPIISIILKKNSDNDSEIIYSKDFQKTSILDEINQSVFRLKSTVKEFNKDIKVLLSNKTTVTWVNIRIVFPLVKTSNPFNIIDIKENMTSNVKSFFTNGYYYGENRYYKLSDIWWMKLVNFIKIGPNLDPYRSKIYAKNINSEPEYRTDFFIKNLYDNKLSDNKNELNKILDQLISHLKKEISLTHSLNLNDIFVNKKDTQVGSTKLKIIEFIIGGELAFTIEPLYEPVELLDIKTTNILGFSKKVSKMTIYELSIGMRFNYKL